MKKSIQKMQVLGNTDPGNVSNLSFFQSEASNLSFEAPNHAQIKLSVGYENLFKPQRGHQTKNEENLRYKRNYTIVFFILFPIFLGITIFAILTKVQEKQQMPADEKNILIRNWQLGYVYHTSFTITYKSSNITSLMFYQYTVAVQKVTPTETYLVASLLKLREESIQDNGNMTVKNFSHDNPFLAILEYGDTILESSNTSEQDTTQFPNITEQLNNTQNFTQNKTLAQVLPVYRYSLFSNGSTGIYTFPFELEKDCIALFKTVTKLFSPILKQQVYTKQPVRRLQQMGLQNSTNYNSSTEPQNQQIDQYSFETTDDQISLSKQTQSVSSDDNHNSVENSSQYNLFNQNGELLYGAQKANTQLSSVELQPAENQKIINMNLNFSCQQSSEMIVLKTFLTNMTNLQKFCGIISSYVQQNITLTTNSQGLQNFIMNSSEASGADSKARLLSQFHVYYFLKMNKQVPILKTNLLGCRFGVSLYNIFTVYLFEDTNYIYRKFVRFRIQIGYGIQLGFYPRSYIFVDIDRVLNGLSYKWTISKAEQLQNQIKDEFVQKVIRIEEEIGYVNFSALIPIIENASLMVRNILSDIDDLQKEISPNRTITKVAELLAENSQITNSSILLQLNPQFNYINVMTQEMIDFVNLRYLEALTFFNQAKSRLTSFKDDGKQFLNQSAYNFTQIELYEIERRIKSMLPNDVYEDYLEQIKKAEPITTLIKIIQTNGTNYLGYLSNSLVSQKKDFIKFIKATVDLYFKNQTTKSDLTNKTILQRLTNISNELQGFKNEVKNFNTTQYNNKILRFFNSPLLDELATNSFIQNWDSRIAVLKNLAYNTAVYRYGPCCEWDEADWLWEDDECIYFNDAYGELEALPSIFGPVSDGWRTFFYMYFSQVGKFINESKQIMNSNEKIQKKHQTIAQKYQQSKQLYSLSSIQYFKSQVQNSLNQAYRILNRVRCGSTYWLRQYINYLTDLIAFIQYFYDLVQIVHQRQIQVKTKFDSDVYYCILENHVIAEGVEVFMQEYSSLQNNTFQLINKLTSITLNYNAQQFVKSTSIADEILTLYQNISKSMSVNCDTYPDYKKKVEDVRSKYAAMLAKVNNKTNTLLQEDLNRTRAYLDRASSTIYSQFILTQFCSHEQNFTAQIRTLTQDYNNFTILYHLYNTLMDIIHENEIKIDSLRLQINKLETNFYRLFTPEGFVNFVQGMQKITKTTKELIYNLSISFSNLKQQSKEVKEFQMCSQDELQVAIAYYAVSPFTLIANDAFLGVEQIFNLSIITIWTISYDVIAVVVLYNDIFRHYNETIEIFLNGVEVIMSQFGDVCDSFLILQNTTTQQQLNLIDQRFSNISLHMNDTLFQNFKLKTDNIFSRYSSYHFTSPTLFHLSEEFLFTDLSNFYRIVIDKKQNIYDEFGLIIKKITKIIEKLEIGKLNRIYSLANGIRSQFLFYVQFVHNKVFFIYELQDTIVSNITKVFEVVTILSDTKQQIQLQYIDLTDSLFVKVNKTLVSFQQQDDSESDFYQKLSNSSFYVKLYEIHNILNINFTFLWTNLLQNQQKIRFQISLISADTVTLIKQLNEIKLQLVGIPIKIQQKLNGVTKSLQLLRRKFSNIKSVIFVSLNEDFQIYILGHVKSIQGAFNKILREDLGIVEQISQSILMQIFSDVNQSFTQLLQLHQTILSLLTQTSIYTNQGLMKIEIFLSDQLVVKMQKLKKGLLFMKSITQFTFNPQSQVFFSFEHEQDQQLVEKHEYILSPIGIFKIAFEITLNFVFTAEIGLRNYRDFYLSVDSQIFIKLQARFSYCLTIMQFGLYISGIPVRAQLTVTFELKNTLPLPLTKQLATISQLAKQNNFGREISIDLAFFGCQTEIGFYIGFLWIRILWLTIKICFRFFRFKFCFSFKIPIGHWFYMRRVNFGYQISSIQIAKMRIFTTKFPIIDYTEYFL